MPQFILDKGRSGIASYMIQLIGHLQKVDSSNEYEISLSEDESKLLHLVNPHFNKIIYPNYFENALFNIGWYNTVLPIKARLHEIDVIHYPCLRRVGVWKPCKIVATAHDLAAFTVPGKYSWPHMLYQKQVVARTIHRCDHLIAVSQQTKADIVRLLNYPADRITVIYPGIDREIYHPIPSEQALADLKSRFGIKAPFIVYVGRLEHPGKNHVRLVKAFELFKSRHPNDYELVFAGADWQGAEVIKECIAQSPQSKSIHTLGFVSRKEIVDLYSATDLMVFPSLYEGFGFPLLEAMACGAPVICSNSSSLAEIGDGNALMFDPLSVEEIYHTILKAIEQHDPKLQMIKNNKHLESFDWNNAAKEVVKVYQKVMG